MYLSPLSLLPDGNDCSVFMQIYLEEEGKRDERGGVRALAYCCVNRMLSEISKQNRCVKWRKVRDKRITSVGAQNEGTVSRSPKRMEKMLAETCHYWLQPI